MKKEKLVNIRNPSDQWTNRKYCIKPNEKGKRRKQIDLPDPWVKKKRYKYNTYPRF
jgi:hypothetical protein